jgi:hypothetical protein
MNNTRIANDLSQDEYRRRRNLDDTGRRINAISFDKIVWQALYDNRTVDNKSIYVTSSVLSPSPGETMLCSCSLAIEVIIT